MYLNICNHNKFTFHKSYTNLAINKQNIDKSISKHSKRTAEFPIFFPFTENNNLLSIMPILGTTMNWNAPCIEQEYIRWHNLARDHFVVHETKEHYKANFIKVWIDYDGTK